MTTISVQLVIDHMTQQARAWEDQSITELRTGDTVRAAVSAGKAAVLHMQARYFDELKRSAA